MQFQAVSEGNAELLFHTRTSEDQLRVSVCQWRVAISTELRRADARYMVGRPLWCTPDEYRQTAVVRCRGRCFRSDEFLRH
jgi:hypothetical protein